MYRLIVLTLLAACAWAQPKVTVRSLVLEQLRSTHNKNDWFVPANAAVEGLTAKQASWTDGAGNHSVGQLANHLIFWNRRVVEQLKGEKSAPFKGSNDETFNAFTEANWAQTVRDLDQVMVDLEKLAETLPDDKIEKYASTFHHIATHNAYHVGQMIFVRKLQGAWNPDKGVK